jgi:cobalt-zinc-cadmium efflux system protein
VNLAAMKVLAGGRHHSLNVKGAYLEVWSDMLGSLGVIAGAAIIEFTGYEWVDSAVAILIGLWVVPRTWTLFKSTLNILLEGVPDDVDLDEVRHVLLSTPGVRSIHDLHVWAVTSGKTSLTVHAVKDAAISAEKAVLPAIQRKLADRFGITHVTVQFELQPCHQSDDEDAGHFKTAEQVLGRDREP